MKNSQNETRIEGEAKKKAGFPKWRLIVIAAIAVLAVSILAGCGGGDSENAVENDGGNAVENDGGNAVENDGGDDGETINWGDMELGNLLPDPPSNKGTIFTNSDEELWLELQGVTDKQYNDYYDACVKKGFNIDGEKSTFFYEAYNSDGYNLDMSFIGDQLSINLTCPEELSDIEWPIGTAGNLLPAPKSTVGKFSYEYDDSFAVEIGNTSKADYKEYVSACSERGFTVDYDKGDDYYYADNAEGWHLYLEYEGFNIMSIWIDPPDEEPEPSETETPEPEPAEQETAEPADSNEDEIGAEFKEAMDSYEAFIDEYIDFMKKYEENPSDLGLLADYATYMSKYAELAEDFEQWEDTDLNTAETAYYIDVQARVSKKLLESLGDYQ